MEFEIIYKTETGDDEPRREKVNIPKYLSGKVTQELRRIFQDHCTTKIYDENGEKKTVVEADRPHDMLVGMGKIIAREVIAPKEIKVDDVSDDTLMNLANQYFESTLGGIGGSKKKD